MTFNAPVTAPYTDSETGITATLLISGSNIQLILILMAQLILLVKNLMMVHFRWN